MNKEYLLRSVVRKNGLFLLAVLAGAFVLLPDLLWSQSSDCQKPDEVVSFTPGQGGGRGSDHLPQSVLGLPDTISRQEIPAIAPEEVLSLGLDGEVVLRFDRVMILDGPGVDFTVFENAFAYSLGGEDRIYAEPGEVAVSRDGIEYRTFVWDEETLAGCAGISPTNGDQDPCDPSRSGGNSFDLAELGMDSVRFIRIRDVTRTVLENKDHAFYDPTVNGFDLDAVIALNTAPMNVTSVHAITDPNRDDIGVQFLQSSAQQVAAIDLPRACSVRIQLFDLLGNKSGQPLKIQGVAGRNYVDIPAANLPSGVYVLLVNAEGIGSGFHSMRLLR